MAIEYFSSMLDTYYSTEDLNRSTILEARRNLKSILGTAPAALTLAPQKSLLQQSISSSPTIVSGEIESVQQAYDSNISTFSAAKAVYDAISTPNSSQINTYKAAITAFYTQINSAAEAVAENLGSQARGTLESVGILPLEWRQSVIGKINTLEAYSVGPQNLDSDYEAIGDAIEEEEAFVGGIEAELLSLYGASLTRISQGVDSVYRTISAASFSISDSYEGFFDSKTSVDTYMSRVFIPLAGQTGPNTSTNWLTIASNFISGVDDRLTDVGVAGLIGDIAVPTAGLIGQVAGAVAGGIGSGVTAGVDFVFGGGAASGIINTITSFIRSDEVRVTLETVGELLTSVFPNYVDGVSESRYGQKMEKSWIGSHNSFLNNLQSINVNFLTTTPLDPSEGQNASLYGNMMLGSPLTYTRVTDPNNRAMINTFVKDSTFLSLTPGLPKYNGGAFQQEVSQLVSNVFRGENSQASTYLNQTDTPRDMVAYLLKNGLDVSFAEKDKRYYTFQAEYEQYFAYLETMLNTLWVKMGLGTAEDGSLNIFSFFNPESTAADYDSSLRDKYRSSIGFFVNPADSPVSEGINNSTISSDLAAGANNRSDDFQRLNFITGMGTAGPARNISRQIGLVGMQTETFTDIVKQNFGSVLGGGGGFLGGLARLGSSIMKFSNTQDMSALVQQFQVTNGMKVMYPEYWNSSNYAKNMTFSFNFVSPYGDPLSIFQYVYVPFFSLLAFAMPRQAAENGLVTPFLVRADMPGIITSDLAMITSVDWVKGGSQGLFTKDKLPRAISGTFTVQDLFPYLSAVKRLSFLSANPSFTVFLDNMAGLRALYNESKDDPYADYWRKLINRVSGSEPDAGLWNVFGPTRQAENSKFATTYQRPSLTRTISKKAAPWLSKI